MIEIDNTIGQIERLYRSLTGRDAPPVGETPTSAIPPEVDPERYVEAQLDRLIGALGGVTPQTPTWTPVASLWETPREYILCIDLPGVTREEVNVSIEGSYLVVTGERRAPRTDEEPAQALWVERGAGAFRREVYLPTGSLPDQTQAHMRDGVLQIHVPKDVQQQQRAAKTISVN